MSEMGSLGWESANSLVRTRLIFAEGSLSAAVLDAPSDRQMAVNGSDARSIPGKAFAKHGGNGQKKIV